MLVTNKRCTSSLLSAFVIELSTQLLNNVFDTQVKNHSSHVFRRRGKRVPSPSGGPALTKVEYVEYLGTLRYLTTVRVPTVPYQPSYLDLLPVGTSINGKMKFLSHIRSPSRHKSTDGASTSNIHQIQQSGTGISLPRSHPSAKFSSTLLQELFSYVCPHSRDDSYTSCEDSMIDGGCMLCDIRDLSQCALVNRQWSATAQPILWVSSRAR